MDVPFSKKLIAVGGLLFVLSLFSFTLTTFSENSCLGENSTLDNQTCVVGENAEMEHTIEVNNSTYGNYRVQELGNITDEGTWKSVSSNYTKYFSNQFQKTGNYEYQMFVSENQSFQNAEQSYNYSFEVVKADNPSGPLSSFQSLIPDSIKEIISELFGLFDSREIGTPEVN